MKTIKRRKKQRHLKRISTDNVMAIHYENVAETLMVKRKIKSQKIKSSCRHLTFFARLYTSFHGTAYVCCPINKFTHSIQSSHTHEIFLFFARERADLPIYFLLAIIEKATTINIGKWFMCRFTNIYLIMS